MFTWLSERGIRDVRLSSIARWCMWYPVIEIRYTSAFIVSSRHSNVLGINSTREKSADDVYIYVMPVCFYAISHPKVEFYPHMKKNKLGKKRETELTIFFRKGKKRKNRNLETYIWERAIIVIFASSMKNVDCFFIL